MIHQMLYLSANAHPQYANVGEKSIVQYQNTGTPKTSATNMRWAGFTTNQE
jgi:hypothetical protein